MPRNVQKLIVACCCLFFTQVAFAQSPLPGEELVTDFPETGTRAYASMNTTGDEIQCIVVDANTEEWQLTMTARPLPTGEWREFTWESPWTEPETFVIDPMPVVSVGDLYTAPSLLHICWASNFWTKLLKAALFPFAPLFSCLRVCDGWNTDNTCSAVPDFNFQQCCKDHDCCYMEATFSRLDCDTDLRNCIAAHGHPTLANLYYVGVRTFGWYSYNYYGCVCLALSTMC